MNRLTSASSVIDNVILNDCQKDAVVCETWPQLVFAGAGSGKTRVLTSKIAYLIQNNGVNPRNIFAATFTNKAAREMRDRVEELIGMSCSGLWIGTFHSMCARILRQQAIEAGYTSDFTIYDKDDQVSQIKKIIKSLDIDERTIQPKHVAGKISTWKNKCLAPDSVNLNGRGMYDKEMLRVYETYQKSLKKQNAMDFDDLITNTVFLFKKNAKVLEYYQNIFKYVLVDEYQDTNASQFELIKLLVNKHGKLFAVGDDDQSIYGWRGAMIENILSFETLFPTAQIFKLEENYRSTENILNFSNSVISTNNNRSKKELWTSKSGGEDVLIVRYQDNRQEADGVANRIEKLKNEGTKLSDIAILFRTNSQSRSFEDVFRRKKIPYVLVGGMSFYERKEIKDCLAYLRLLVNNKDDVGCDRILNVPPRGIGAKSKETLVNLAKENNVSILEAIMSDLTDNFTGRGKTGLEEFKTAFALLIDLKENNVAPDKILNEMLTVTGYVESLENEDSEESDARLENINELVNMLTIWTNENPGGTLGEFLEEVTLASDVDRWNNDDKAVNLMTFHSAKGLEFHTVFLVGLEDGIIPSRQNFDDEQKIEEECRLLYVGATRAQKYLECSYVDQRWRFGSVMPMLPSRFIKTVPDKYFKFIDKTTFDIPSYNLQSKTNFKRNYSASAGSKMYTQTSPKQVRRPSTPAYEDFSQDVVEYRMGQHVSHPKYGPGKILSINGFGPDMRITVLFSDGARRKMMAKFANLEIL